MKKLLLTLLLFVAVQGMAQKSYIELRQEYKKECEQMVIDTVTEHGTVNYEIQPVGDELKLIPVDTIWNKVKCPEYKEGGLYFGDVALSLVADTLSNGTGYIWYDGSEINYGKPNNSTFEVEITRQKYCPCKLRRPTQEGFWKWIDKNYLE